jgi:hypothetical protein
MLMEIRTLRAECAAYPGSIVPAVGAKRELIEGSGAIVLEAKAEFDSLNRKNSWLLA